MRGQQEGVSCAMRAGLGKGGSVNWEGGQQEGMLFNHSR